MVQKQCEFNSCYDFNFKFLQIFQLNFSVFVDSYDVLFNCCCCLSSILACLKGLLCESSFFVDINSVNDLEK